MSPREVISNHDGGLLSGGLILICISDKQVHQQSGDIRLSFRVTPELAERIDQLAAHTGRGRSQFLRASIAPADTHTLLAGLRALEAHGPLPPDARQTRRLAVLTLHEARHTYASLMVAAGVNPKTLSTFMGHATIAVTLDLYGKLFPGSEDEAAALLDGYLARAVGASTVAQTVAHTEDVQL